MPLRQAPTTAVQAPLVLLTGTLPKERLCTALRRPIGDYCHFPRPRHWKLPSARPPRARFGGARCSSEL